MKIGIKYCGGCKTTYDRVESVKKLIENFPEYNFEPAKEDVEYEVILIVNGCKTACAKHETLSAKKRVFLNSIDDFQTYKIKFSSNIKNVKYSKKK